MVNGNQDTGISALQGLSGEMKTELHSILDYWKKYVLTPDGKSFYGSVANNNRPDPAAIKGVVMHARILWSFSEAYQVTADKTDLAVAGVACQYLMRHFHDKESDGFYWSLDAAGEPHETRKQVYGQAFCLYGFAAFYKQSRNPHVLQQAQDLFNLIEDKCRDQVKGGYIEAFNRDWSPASELRLSAKDQNDRKTMNTHLHIIEAYSALYRVWPDAGLRDSISALLGIFREHFIDRQTGALNLFFDDDWQSTSTLRSYGHDIEASWLLLQCAEVINDPMMVKDFRELALLTAEAASEGLDTDGGLWYESAAPGFGLVKEKPSWPQAEAMIGFLNAWQVSGDDEYLQRLHDSWQFIKKYLKDNKGGEWYWGVNGNYSLMDKEKAGFWKCCYHNTRACLELMDRIKTIEKP